MNINELKKYVENNKKNNFVFISNFIVLKDEIIDWSQNNFFIVNSYKNNFSETEVFLKKIDKSRILVIDSNKDEIYQNLKNFNNVIDSNLFFGKYLDNKKFNLFKNSNFEEIKKIIDNYFWVHGIVIKGLQRSNTFNFPTANIIGIISGCIQTGVYYTKVIHNKKEYNGATCVLNFKNQLKIETFILDFDKNIYNDEIKVSFIKKIRENKKFDSIEKLKEAINNDVDEIKKIKDFFND